jgi:hypothetical protein
MLNSGALSPIDKPSVGVSFPTNEKETKEIIINTTKIPLTFLIM